MKHVIRIILVFIIFTSVLPGTAFAKDVPDADPAQFFVTDSNEVLSQNARTELNELGRFLEDKTTAQVKLLTVDKLEGDTPEAFATKAFDYYELGAGDVNNGVLIMFAEDDREIYIKLGKGAMEIISEDDAGVIMDTYAIPYFKDEKYEEGLVNTYKKVAADVAEHYNVTSDVEASGNDMDAAAGETSGFLPPEMTAQLKNISKETVALIVGAFIALYAINPWLAIIAAIGAVLFILIMFSRLTRRNRRGYRNRRYNNRRDSSPSRNDRGSGGSSSGGGGSGRSW